VVGTWILRRSRLPGLLAAALTAASGVGGMAGDGWLWWAGASAGVAGLGMLSEVLLRPAELLRLTLGDPVRLERVGQGTAASRLLAEGRISGASVVTPWLLALRIEGRHSHADLVLTAGSAAPEDLRRLRARLLGGASPRD